MNNILNLENVEENIDKLVDKYHIGYVSSNRYSLNTNRYLLDGDLEDLFCDSDIEIGETIYKAKDAAKKLYEFTKSEVIVITQGKKGGIILLF